MNVFCESLRYGVLLAQDTAPQPRSFWDNSTLIFWGAITLMVVVPSIAHYWYKLRRAQIDADLKHDMVARGMSAEEIERVLAADRREANVESDDE